MRRSRMQRVLLLVCLGLLFSAEHGYGCYKNKQPCSNERQTRESCQQLKPLLEYPNVGCCYEEGNTGSPNCFYDPEAVLVGRNLVQESDSFATQLGLYDKPTQQELTDATSKIPLSTDPGLQRQFGGNLPPNLNNDLAQRSSGFLFLALAGGSSSNFLQSALFPECPVHVKYCYRVRCGASLAAQNNPRLCLQDPTCCFDYKLAFLKSILTNSFMADAPTCYYGPTSSQWRYITNFFKPWNTWYTQFILDAFGSVFDTNALDISGQLACSFTQYRKAYPVGAKSKLECSLVSGCWDESLPVGSQCTMSSSLTDSLFFNLVGVQGARVYPTLYTDDPSETQCSANWFDFGPAAYKRMPCGIGTPPDNLVEKLAWCPINDCCLNYASLSPQDILLLQLFNNPSGSGGNSFGGFGGLGGGLGLPSGGFGIPGLGGLGSFGGLPGFGGTTPNSLPAYLLLSQTQGSSSSLEDLFCPYRNFFSGSSLLPDLSEFTDGCCELPDCYHKKKLQRPSTAWGQWSPCSVTCGSGVRTRACRYSNGQSAPAGNCPGASSEGCSLPPCFVAPPYEWGPWSQCSVTCGSGTRSRGCLYGSCVGQSTESCTLSNCPPIIVLPPPVQTASWGQWQNSGCSATCGGGSSRWSRQCLIGGVPTNPANCPGIGQASGSPCSNQPCPSSYTWSGQQIPVGPCSVTCGTGSQSYTRQCVDFNQTPVSSQLCPQPPPATTVGTCNAGPCPVNGQWTAWVDSTSCGSTCGSSRIKTQTRQCQANGQTLPDSRCIGEATRVVTCPDIPCPSQYSWTGWSSFSSNTPCQFNQQTGQCTFQRTRYCYQNNGGSWSYVQPQSNCGGQTTKLQNCAPQQCFGQG